MRSCVYVPVFVRARVASLIGQPSVPTPLAAFSSRPDYLIQPEPEHSPPPPLSFSIEHSLLARRPVEQRETTPLRQPARPRHPGPLLSASPTPLQASPSPPSQLDGITRARWRAAAASGAGGTTATASWASGALLSSTARWP